jgi:hypothetical protein
VTEIRVQDGGMPSRYDSIDKVPEAYRDKVRRLVNMNEKEEIKIDNK